MKAKLKKRVLWIVAVCVVAAGTVGGLYLARVSRYQAKVGALQDASIDLTAVADGVYEGEFDADIVGARVEVTVRAGRIERVTILEHKQERGAAAEAVTDAMVREQRVDVEAVAGATNSSKVIKKAVENALLGQPQ